MGFLTKFIPGGWIAYAVLGIAVFAAGSYAGDRLRGFLDAPIIADLRTDVAKARGDAKDALAALANQQKQIALDAQAASESALASERALQAQVADLNAKLATTEQRRREASTKLLDTLRDIPHEQQSPLPASSRQYLRGVLDAQRTAANPTPAADNHQDGVSVPRGAGGTSVAVPP